MHSTTKYLNGHSDGIGGALIGSTPEHKERFLLVQKAAGGVMSPFECFLVLRGIKTMPLRIKQHEENGRAVAAYLSTHPKVGKLAYPGLKSHPQYELAVKQQKGFGSMMSMDLGSREAAGRFLSTIKIFLNAESLGRGGVAGFAFRDDDPRLGERGRACGDGHHRRAGAAFHRHRGQGRPDCRFGAGRWRRCKRGHPDASEPIIDRASRTGSRLRNAGPGREALARCGYLRACGLGRLGAAGRGRAWTGRDWRFWAKLSLKDAPTPPPRWWRRCGTCWRQRAPQCGELACIVAVNGPGSFTGVRLRAERGEGTGRASGIRRWWPCRGWR